MAEQTKQTWALSLKYPEESISELCKRLNEEQILDNPDKQGKVPAPIVLSEVRQTVTDEEAFAVLDSQIWLLTLQALKDKDYSTVSTNIKALVAGKLLSQESAIKLSAFLKKTIPDPNYKDKIKISLCKQAGFDFVTEQELNQ